MQLKKVEPAEEQKSNSEGMPGSGIVDSAVQESGAPSNNEFFNPELEFDPIGDGIFDTPKVTTTPNDPYNTVVNDPYNTGANNTYNTGANNAYNTGTNNTYNTGMNNTYNTGMNSTYSGGTNSPYSSSNTNNYYTNTNTNGSYGNGTNNNAGAPYNSNENDKYDPSTHPRKLTKKEFFDSPRNRKDRDRIIISAIVVIATAIFDVIRTDFWLSALKKQIDFVNDMSEQLGMSEYVIDTQKIMTTQIIVSVILIALGLGILILKSRACAVAGFVLTVINFVSTLRSVHQFKWYWAMIAFVYAIAATFSFASNWKDYEENGDWKREW